MLLRKDHGDRETSEEASCIYEAAVSGGPGIGSRSEVMHGHMSRPHRRMETIFREDPVGIISVRGVRSAFDGTTLTDASDKGARPPVLLGGASAAGRPVSGELELGPTDSWLEPSFLAHYREVITP
jgi:hypothetical protein